MANSTRFVLAAVSLGGVVAFAVGGWFVYQTWFAVPAIDPRSLPFWESAAEAGLDWQMRFLPGEQGEKFKINLYDHGCGLAVGDYDGDGHEDLYFTNQLGPNALFRNKGDGTFEDVTATAGVALGDRVCVAAAFADYDNDGRQDLYVTSTRGGNVLFRNQGGGKFLDVTDQAKVGHVGHSQTAVFFDYDNDGFLDLFLTNTAAWTTEEFDKPSRAFVGKGDVGGFAQVVHSPKEFNILFRNSGNGAFTDVTEKTGLKGRGWAGDAVAFDYNDDGRLDLFVTCMFGRAQLYRNNPDGAFTDVTLDVLGRTPWGGVGARAWDYNNDGRLDLLVVDMHSDMWMGLDFKHESLEKAKTHQKRKFTYYNGPNVQEMPFLATQEEELGRQIGFKHSEVLFGNALFRNEGNGKFTEASDEAGLETFWPWGVAPGDFDNNGHEDVFIPAGMGYPFYYWPNSLMMNQGNGTFRDRAAELGVEPPLAGVDLPEPIGGKPAPRSSRCAVTADFDGDGRLEIVTNNFNDRPYFFKNQLPPRNFIAFRLRGTKSNRDAVGAVVRLERGGKVLTRQVQGASGYLSQSSQVVHFGLGDKTEVEKVEILWPSGRRQRLDNVAGNKIHAVVEPDKD